MAGYYSNFLKGNPGDHHKLIHFDPHVVDKYLKNKGPWTASIDKPDELDTIYFWGWQNGYSVLLVKVTCGMGREDGSATGKRLAYLTDLAAMPKEEQEHWHNYER